MSEDLKHDAHIIKVFTARSLSVLRKNKVDICKIIEFTDQAPSQCKNKTSFNHLASNDIPAQKNYFGVRHGKSSCDACTGRVKQGVTRLVKSEQEVVNSAQTFYETCVKHLEKPLIESEDKCQHYILTFEYHKKLGNTNGRELYYRKFACCCFGCIHGSEACSNNICPDEWSAYDLGKKQSVEPNLQFWFG